MIKRTILFSFLLFFVVNSYAQLEASHWYFGNGVALDFSSGTPVAVNDGELFTNEGSASIADEAGKLLFYSDGVSVWNKNHQLMSNGTGLNGANSSTQSCIILKKLKSDSHYYIFTVDELAGSKGLSYSIVDMKQNNGLGAVIVKNQQLLTPVSEKLTAVLEYGGKGWWVIAHQWNTNTFYSYLLNENGVSAPVLSKIGAVHKNAGTPINSGSIGYLKASPDGTKLASVICYTPNNNIELFDFNNQTGSISNLVNLPSPGNAYGVCFSPDNSKLYVSYESLERGVVQYNLAATNIAESAIRVSPVDNTRYGALQIGPDDKIYIAKLGQFLDVITKPNGLARNCNFRTNFVNLKGNYSTFGLPDFFVLQHNRLKLNLGNDTVVCEKRYDLDAKIELAQYRWSTGETVRKITVDKSGTYKVTVTKNEQSVTDSVSIKLRKPLVVELGKDTVVCGDMFPIDGGNSGLNYRWSSGASSQVYVATKSGKYSVTVTDGICIKSDSIKVTFPSTGKPFIAIKKFKPNNAGFNDRFDFILNAVTWFNLKIKSDKGKTVFETENRNEKWDGFFKEKRVPKGVYTWKVKFKTECTGDKINEQKGEVEVQ